MAMYDKLYIQFNTNKLLTPIINTTVLQRELLAFGVFGWCSEVFGVTLLQGEIVVMGHFTSLQSSTSLYPSGIVCERKKNY
jgi:hypothetical protein